jgi:hypothetical protein
MLKMVYLLKYLIFIKVNGVNKYFTWDQSLLHAISLILTFQTKTIDYLQI